MNAKPQAATRNPIRKIKIAILFNPLLCVLLGKFCHKIRLVASPSIKKIAENYFAS